MGKRKLEARLVPVIDVEMAEAGMREWDAQHARGVRHWPIMLLAVYAAMKAVDPSLQPPTTPASSSAETGGDHG